MSRIDDLHSSGEGYCLEAGQMHQKVQIAETHAPTPAEAFPDIPGSIRDPNELKLTNGCIKNWVEKGSSARTSDFPHKRVHFSPPDSPVCEEIPTVSSSPRGDGHLRALLSGFAFVFAAAALLCCILLYVETSRLRADIRGLEKVIFGSSTIRKDVAQQLSRRKSLVEIFENRTRQIGLDLDHLRAWANTSACISGHDFTSGQFCYRLVRFQLEFAEADAFCRRRGGYLAFSDDETSWNKTVRFLLARGFKLKEVWAGVRKDGHGEWRYVDGRVVGFAPWARGNLFDEGDDCAQMRLDPIASRSGLYDRRCTNIARPFLCRFKIT